MAMLTGVLAFAGCKNNKDNQDTTAASTGIDAVDAANTTEPSADSTAAESSTAKETKPSSRPTQTVPAAATTDAQMVTLPTSNSTEKPDDGSSTGWNGAGNYKCGSGSGKLAPGEYYIVKTSSKYSALLWDGKKKDDKGQPLAYDITIDGAHTLVTLESGYEL